MIGLIVDKEMRVQKRGFNSFWQTIKSLNGEWFFLKESQPDLDKHGIGYTIGEVEIKQYELNVE